MLRYVFVSFTNVCLQLLLWKSFLKHFRQNRFGIPGRIWWIVRLSALNIRQCILVFWTDMDSAPQMEILDSTSLYRNEEHGAFPLHTQIYRVVFRPSSRHGFQKYFSSPSNPYKTPFHVFHNWISKSTSRTRLLSFFEAILSVKNSNVLILKRSTYVTDKRA